MPNNVSQVLFSHTKDVIRSSLRIRPAHIVTSD